MSALPGPKRPSPCWLLQIGVLDEQGWLYALTERGLGLVHSQDMDRAADLVESGAWQPETVPRNELPQRFGFQLHP